jgi:hypothetical protein
MMMIREFFAQSNPLVNCMLERRNDYGEELQHELRHMCQSSDNVS